MLHHYNDATIELILPPLTDPQAKALEKEDRGYLWDRSIRTTVANGLRKMGYIERVPIYTVRTVTLSAWRITPAGQVALCQYRARRK